MCHNKQHKIEYARHLNIIHYNHIKVLEGMWKRPLQHAFNFGLPRPKNNEDVVKEEIISNFTDYVLPKLKNVSRVCIMLGMLTERTDELNVKFFQPDFNSNVNFFQVTSRVKGTHQFRDALGGSSLHSLLNINQLSMKYKLLFYTNIKFCIFF